MSGRRNGEADLLVVGGGVIGLAVARDAHARGMRVTVLERGRCGREASWAAAGMLSPLGEAAEPGPFLRFGLESLRAWPGFAGDLEEETGVALGYREGGKLRLALSEAEEKRLHARHEWAREEGVPARWLGADDARRAEPHLAAHVRGALLLEEDYRIDNRALGNALAKAAERRGIGIREGTAVREVTVRNERVDGVVVEGGERLAAGTVLLAAGAWTGMIGGLTSPVPVRPVRGEMLALRPERPISDRVLESERIYLVPRDDGRLLAGATVDDVGFRPGATAAGVHSLLDAALELVPALSSAPIDEIWSGFRPASPDGVPLLGAHPGVEDLYLATGHFRNGILLTPATASAIGAMVAGQEGPRPPEEFAPRRLLQRTGVGSAHDSLPQESSP